MNEIKVEYDFRISGPHRAVDRDGFEVVVKLGNIFTTVYIPSRCYVTGEFTYKEDLEQAKLKLIAAQDVSKECILKVSEDDNSKGE